MTTEVSDAAALSARLGRLIRAHRAGRGMSLGELARSAGLSKTILARIERGEGNPSIDTLWRLHRALQVPLGALLAEDAGPRVRRIAHRSGEPLSAASGMEAWLVHADGRDHRGEVYELHLPAGVTQRSEPHLPGTEELVVCVAGALRAGPLAEPEALGAGDAVWFAADVPHAYAGVRDARALCWMRYPAVGGGR